MIDFTARPCPAPHSAPTSHLPHGDITMLIQHEALARSRHRSDIQAAREHAVARRLTAGRTWSALADWAQRRAEASRLAVHTVEPGPPAPPRLPARAYTLAAGPR